MRQRVVLLFAALMLASATVGVGGIDARSTTGTTASDFAFASFDDQFGTHFLITAWNTGAGGKARGVFQTSIEWLQGNVRCLAVHRHDALVIANNHELRLVITVALRDVRHGPDELLWVDSREGSAPRPCPYPWDGGPAGTPVSGDIWVHDAR
jgi:hypothetical protein